MGCRRKWGSRRYIRVVEEKGGSRRYKRYIWVVEENGESRRYRRYIWGVEVKGEQKVQKVHRVVEENGGAEGTEGTYGLSKSMCTLLYWYTRIIIVENMYLLYLLL
jgi:hypothetical protein